MVDVLEQQECEQEQEQEQGWKRSYGTPISTVKSTDESISASLPTNQSQLLCRRINLSFSPSPPPKNLSAASHNRFLTPQTRSVAKDHLLRKPFPKHYVIWTLHGERRVPESSRNEEFVQETFHSKNLMGTMLNDAFGNYRQDTANLDESDPIATEEAARDNSSDFHEFLNDGSQLLQEGSHYTKLEFIIKLYHIKVLNHRFRLNRVRFDGNTEERNSPLKKSGSDILRQLEDAGATFIGGARTTLDVKEFFVRKVVVAAAVTVNHAAAAAQTVFHHSVVSLYLPHVASGSRAGSNI
ncbi:hypothetical protein QL285_070438 [Trifolium repens]|nr:hypothetical protein QL285_070438 [Trifolium repens]